MKIAENKRAEMLFFSRKKFLNILFNMNKTIAIVGANGKMGKLVCEALKNEFEIVEISKNNNLFEYENIDLVVDFGSAESSVNSAEFCFAKKVPLIVGSTGQTKEQLEKIKKVVLVSTLVVSANFSLGFVLLSDLIKKLGDYSGYFDDVVVFEKHHKQKKDKPSGTAIDLKEKTDQAFGCSADVIAERGGKEVGTHVVDIYFGDEVLSLSHKVFGRNAFVFGVKLVVQDIFEMPQGEFLFEDFVKRRF